MVVKVASSWAEGVEAGEETHFGVGLRTGGVGGVS